ncbi:anti-sigma regulatory factor [Gammaproteobacteria bacterium AS21]
MTLDTQKSLKFQVYDEVDVAYAALGAKKYAQAIGFNSPSQYMISTAVSELARNIYVYAKKGTVLLNYVDEEFKLGMQVIADDCGPGIVDIEKALLDTYSTGGTMGVGLPGTKRLMDEFKIESIVGKGTKVTIVKWL